jgi:membrane-bound lytic murein transglycosylase B
VIPRQRRSYALVGAAALLFSALLQGAPQTASGPFEDWLGGVRKEALRDGISSATLDTALTGLAPIPRVLELDRSQPEFTLSFQEYLQRVVPDSRVEAGRRKLRQNRAVLQAVGAQYGVQPRFIVALWGLESAYGRLTGSFPVVGALATLAYDGRRAAYFRRELFDALHILDQQHISPERMTGSWAGAMGQVQFMPSSFRRYAVDQDGDGRRDIWRSKADVFASAANYLAKLGWRSDQIWGRRVRLPEGFDRRLLGSDRVRPLGEWRALGVRRSDGRDLPHAELPTSIVQPGGADGAAYAVYDNYRALLRWNRSDYFAVAVGILSDRIAGR